MFVAPTTNRLVVSGTFGTSKLWNKVDGGWIADAYTYTGSDGRLPGLTCSDTASDNPSAAARTAATPALNEEVKQTDIDTARSIDSFPSSKQLLKQLYLHVSVEELVEWWLTVSPDVKEESKVQQAYAEWLKGAAQASALKTAGMNPSSWDPQKGLTDVTRPQVEAVYQYYGNLYLNHSELQWTGMAKLAGAAVYAGMQDM